MYVSFFELKFHNLLSFVTRCLQQGCLKHGLLGLFSRVMFFDPCTCLALWQRFSKGTSSSKWMVSWLLGDDTLLWGVDSMDLELGESFQQLMKKCFFCSLQVFENTWMICWMRWRSQLNFNWFSWRIKLWLKSNSFVESLCPEPELGRRIQKVLLCDSFTVSLRITWFHMISPAPFKRLEPLGPWCVTWKGGENKVSLTCVRLSSGF